MKTQFPLEPEEEEPQSHLAFAPPVQLQAFNCSSRVAEVSSSSSPVGNVSFLLHFCIQDLILLVADSYSSFSIRVANILQMWWACSVQCCQASSVSLTVSQLLLIVSGKQKHMRTSNRRRESREIPLQNISTAKVTSACTHPNLELHAYMHTECA